MSQLKPLMQKNFIDYASYVIIDRAIPDLHDGCKPVQRRILNTLHEMNDGKFHKVASVIGETMKLHPHGDRSIGDALVMLANKNYFIERQGNFGNPITGHDAAAARYIECRLTPLALETLFNRSLTEFVPSYDGRKKEPVRLPAKVPVLLMLGIEGIAVGMSTKILPHNFPELLQAQISILKGQTVEIAPDFPQGGLADITDYDDGRGRVRARASIEISSPKKLVIREIPYSTTTSSLISSIESAIQKGKVSVATIDDFTSEKVEIELTTSRGVKSEEVLPQLYAYTDCEVSLHSNIVVIRDNRPIEITVTDYLREFTALLKRQIKAELEHELGELDDRRHWLTLEMIFIENKVYGRLEAAKTEKALAATVRTGMKPFSKLFVRPMTDDDVRKLLELRIRRISAYDIERNRGEIDDIVAAIKRCKTRLRALTKTVITYLEGLGKEYGGSYPRRSRITTFDQVDKRSVAVAGIKLSYDAQSGFYGSSVRGGTFPLTVSEYDRILAVTADGAYRIMAPQEKLFLPARLLYCAVFDSEQGKNFTVVYRDENKVAWGKRVHIQKYITDKVYDLTGGSPTGIDYLSDRKVGRRIKLAFVPAPRQRVKSTEYDLETLKPCGISARGTRLHAKPVRRVSMVRGAG